MENRKSVAAMFTYEAVQEALQSESPRVRLDELVRAELSVGRTTRQIYEQLLAHSTQVDAIPGLTDEASNAFGDTLDALTGRCHPNCQYRDPPAAISTVESDRVEYPPLNTNVTP